MWQLGNAVAFYRHFNDSELCTICKKLTVREWATSFAHKPVRVERVEQVVRVLSWGEASLFISIPKLINILFLRLLCCFCLLLPLLLRWCAPEKITFAYMSVGTRCDCSFVSSSVNSHAKLLIWRRKGKDESLLTTWIVHPLKLKMKQQQTRNEVKTFPTVNERRTRR